MELCGKFSTWYQQNLIGFLVHFRIILCKQRNEDGKRELGAGLDLGKLWVCFIARLGSINLKQEGVELACNYYGPINQTGPIFFAGRNLMFLKCQGFCSLGEREPNFSLTAASISRGNLGFSGRICLAFKGKKFSSKPVWSYLLTTHYVANEETLHV